MYLPSSYKLLIILVQLKPKYSSKEPSNKAFSYWFCLFLHWIGWYLFGWDWHTTNSFDCLSTQKTFFSKIAIWSKPTWKFLVSVTISIEIKSHEIVWWNIKCLNFSPCIIVLLCIYKLLLSFHRRKQTLSLVF